MNKREWLAHLDACHERWTQVLNRRKGASNYRDEWNGEQCGACQYYVPLRGELGADWGACTNAASPFDRKVMFEHDGCNYFTAAVDEGENPFK
jgi:hypothetical protein